MVVSKIERDLVAGEITMLKEVFGGALTYKIIKIRNHDPDDATNTRSFCSGNVIHLLDDDYSSDISAVSDWIVKSAFVHEAAHAWQYQRTGFCSGQQERDAHFTQVQIDTTFREEMLYQEIDDQVGKQPLADRKAVREYLEQEYYKHQLDSLSNVRVNAIMRIGDDKSGYVSREGYDPIIPFGPQPKDHIYQMSFTPGTPSRLDRETFAMNLAVENTPLPGERLSDFLWRDERMKKFFGKKDTMLHYMRFYAMDDDDSGSASRDYNYMLRRPGSVDFFDLRDEAQAQLIMEYYLIKNGIDPRSVSFKNMVTRPKLKFYETIIPFVCNPVN